MSGLAFEVLPEENIRNIRKLFGADRRVLPDGAPVAYPGTPARAQTSVSRAETAAALRLSSDLVSYLVASGIDKLGMPPGWYDKTWHLANRSCARVCLANINPSLLFWQSVIDYGCAHSYHRRRMTRMTYVKRFVLPEYVASGRGVATTARLLEDSLRLDGLKRTGKVVGKPKPEFDRFFDARGKRK